MAKNHSAGLSAQTWNHLCELNDQSNKLLEVQTGQPTTESSLVLLQRKVEKLRRRHQQLQQQLAKRNLRSKLLAQADQEETTKKQDGMLSVELKTKVVDAARKSAKRRKMNEVHLAYRLAGHTAFPLSPTRTGIQFETFYNGRYMEQYFVILELKGDLPQIYKHTLPPCVPLKQIKKTLKQDVRRGLLSIGKYLNTYVWRREQAADFQDKFGHALKATIQCSNACDIMQFAVEAEGKDVVVQLVFGNLASKMPTEVSLHESGRDMRIMRYNEDIFMQNNLIVAFEKCFPEYAPSQVVE